MREAVDPLVNDPNYTRSLHDNPLLVAPQPPQSPQTARVVQLVREAIKYLQAYPTGGIGCLLEAESTLLDLLKELR